MSVINAVRKNVLESTDGGSSMLSLGLRLLFLLFALAVTLVLDVLVVDGHGLIDLGSESAVIVDTKSWLAIVDTACTKILWLLTGSPIPGCPSPEAYQ